jgi:hypothetical protein
MRQAVSCGANGLLVLLAAGSIYVAEANFGRRVQKFKIVDGK